MRISVALCTYNGEKYIKEQLDSILNQTIPPDEIIICDDKSTDSTVNIINDISNKSKIGFNINIHEKNIGTIKNFEKAISLTTGDVIFLADQDDIWYPEKIEKMVSIIRNKRDFLMLFSNGKLINKNGELMGNTLWEKWHFDEKKQNQWKNNRKAFSDLLINNNYVTGATALISKKLKDKIIPITVPPGYYHDAWFALHASANNGLFFIEESLILYRIHDEQQVGITPGGNFKFDNNTVISNVEFKKLVFNRYPILKIILKTKKTTRRLLNLFRND